MIAFGPQIVAGGIRFGPQVPGSLYALTIAGDIRPGNVISISSDVPGDPVAQSVTLDDIALTVSGSDWLIPPNISLLRNGTYTLTVVFSDIDSSTASSTETLLVEDGFNVVEFSGVVPDPILTDSLYEIILGANDTAVGFSPQIALLQGDQVVFTPVSNLSIDDQTLLTLNPYSSPASGQYRVVFASGDPTTDLYDFVFQVDGQLTFIDAVDVDPDITITLPSQIIPGEDTLTDLPISISVQADFDADASYSVDGSPYSNNSPSTVRPGQSIAVRATSSPITTPGSTSRTSTITVTIGDAVSVWTITTEERDVTPDPVVFTPQVDVLPGVFVESNVVTLSGIDYQISATLVTDDVNDNEITVEASINGGSYVANGDPSLDALLSGDTIQLRVISSTVALEQFGAGIFLEGVLYSFNVTTRAANSIAPIITLTGGDLTINQGDTFSEPGYSATDDLDGDLTSQVVVGGAVDSSIPNTYVLTYDVSDLDGNAAIQQTRTVTVSGPDVFGPSIDASIYLLPAADDGYPLSLYAGNTNNVVIRDVLSSRLDEVIEVSTGTVELRNDTETVFDPADFNSSDDVYVVSIPHTVTISSGDSLTLVVDIESTEGTKGHWEIAVDVIARTE